MDIEQAKLSREALRPLIPLVTTAGDSAYIQGAFANKGSNLDLTLGVTYGRLHMINSVIEGRELYRMTNAAMSNFSQRRALIDSDVQQEIMGAAEILRSLRGEIADGKASATRTGAKIP